LARALTKNSGGRRPKSAASLSTGQAPKVTKGSKRSPLEKPYGYNKILADIEAGAIRCCSIFLICFDGLTRPTEQLI
jgi:hypothetical protein